MKDKDLQLRKFFNLIYKTSDNVAIRYSTNYQESLKLEDHEPWQNVLILSHEKRLFNQQLCDFKRKDYLNCEGKESRYFNLYYAALLMKGLDERNLVAECLKFSKRLKMAPKAIKDAKLLLSPFPFACFMNGELDVLFYRLGEKPLRTSLRDYCKMLSCQTQKNQECVQLLFGDFRRRLIEGLKEDELPTCHLRSVKLQLNDLLRNCRQMTADQLVHQFYHVLNIAPGSLTLPKREFYRLFCKFSKGKDSFHTLSPEMYETFLANRKEGKLSNVLICCWALRKFRQWLTDVLDEKLGLHDTPFCDYGQLFEQIFERALAKSRELMAGFKAKYPSGSLSRLEYQSILFQELRKLGEAYNLLDHPQYYQLLLVRENVKTCFVDHCFLDGDLPAQSLQLRKSIVVNELNKFFKSELSRMDEGLIKPSFDRVKTKDHFADLISAMVPGLEVSELMWRAFNRIDKDLAARKPYFFIEEDFKKAMEHIFNKTFDELSKCLDAQPNDVVIAYALIQLKELKGLALNPSAYETFIYEYLIRLIKLFELKLKYARLDLDVILTRIGLFAKIVQKKDFKPKPGPKPIKALAFNCHNTNDKIILAAMKYLVQIGAIPKDTTFLHFNSKFNGMNGTEPIEWLAAQGDFATFIKEINRIMGPEFAPNKQHLNIASDCFVQKGGVRFDPQKLRFSKPTMLKQKYIKAARMFR